MKYILPGLLAVLTITGCSTSNHSAQVKQENRERKNLVTHLESQGHGHKPVLWHNAQSGTDGALVIR